MKAKKLVGLLLLYPLSILGSTQPPILCGTGNE